MKIQYFRFLSILLFLFPLAAFPQTLEPLLHRETLSAAVDLAFDPQGDLIVLSHRGPATDAAYGNRNGLLAKYSRAGELIWETEVWSDYSYRSAVAVDERGRTYVTFENDYFQLNQYDTDGNLQWEKILPAGAAEADFPPYRFAPGALLAADGGVYVGAGFSGNSFFEVDSLIDETLGDGILLARFSDSGEVEWVRQLQARGSSSTVYGLARDYEGNLILAGNAFLGVSVDTFVVRSGGQLGFLAKWTPAGEIRWLRAFKGEVAGGNCRAVAVDKQNNIYAAGSLRGPAVRKYSPEGEVLWTQRPEPVNSDVGSGVWNDLIIDGYGHLYLAGAMGGTLTFGDRIVTATDLYDYDKLLARYSLDGNLEEILLFPGDEMDNVFSLTAFENELYLAGYTGGVVGSQSRPFENYLTVDRYVDQRTSLVDRYDQELNLFPNPNAGRFCLYLDAGFRESPTVALYDTAGRQVYRRRHPAVFPSDPFLVLDLPQLAAGVYLLEVRNEEKRSVVKMVVER